MKLYPGTGYIKRNKEPTVNIKSIVERNDTVPGRTFDLIMQALILFAIVSFSIETLPDLETSTRKFLYVTEVVIVVIFTVEYLLRFYVADKKLDYVLSFYGIIDLIAILPFYLSFLLLFNIDFRSIRIFRFLRLLRLIKLFRSGRAVRRFSRAFVIVKEEIVLFSVITMMLLYLSAVGIYYFENEAQHESFKSIFHSLWWAVATLTTVGYGDVYPITAGGKIFTFTMLILGLGIVAVRVGLAVVS